MSVLLPTKNGGPRFERVLQRIYEQEAPFRFEVVAVDSGSTDGTLDALEAHPARVHRIPPRQFNHGGTRNLLASLARGRVLVFLSQDAVPCTRRWLATLVRPLLEDGVAGAYARQVPRPGTDPVTAFFLRHVYPATPRTQRLGDDGLSLDAIHFSNVASAIRRDVLEEMPFRDDIIMAEDQEWSARVLGRGHELRYVADARVEHAHEYTLRGLFRRYFDSGAAYRDILGVADTGSRFSLEFVRSGLHLVRTKLRHLARTGNARWIPRALLVSAVKLVAVFAGRHHTVLPGRLKARLSQHGDYWLAEQPTRPKSGDLSRAKAREEGG